MRLPCRQTELTTWFYWPLIVAEEESLPFAQAMREYKRLFGMECMTPCRVHGGIMEDPPRLTTDENE